MAWYRYQKALLLTCLLAGGATFGLATSLAKGEQPLPEHRYNAAQYWLPNPPLTFSKPSAMPEGAGLTKSVTLTDLLKITREPALLDALQVLADSPYRESITWLQKRNGRVVLKDLRTMGKAVANFDAMSWFAPNGQWMIFINHHHKDAPAQALAALLAHETLHDDGQNSITEEITGWQREADAWAWFVKQQGLASGATDRWPLVNRLETLRQAALSNDGVEALVRQNPGYQHLPEGDPAVVANKM